MPALSVIIPTLNEASELPETLKRARADSRKAKEIIVVDAGSTDDTKAIAREHNCTVLESEPSRGKQLRLGAQQASGFGNVILFLHADTWLPENAGVVIAKTLARPLVVAGGFYKRFRDGGALPGSRLRCWLLWALANRLFGDQAIFVKRDVLEQCGWRARRAADGRIRTLQNPHRPWSPRTSARHSAHLRPQIRALDFPIISIAAFILGIAVKGVISHQTILNEGRFFRFSWFFRSRRLSQALEL